MNRVNRSKSKGGGAFLEEETISPGGQECFLSPLPSSVISMEMKSSFSSRLPMADRCFERDWTDVMIWAVVSAMPPRTWVVCEQEDGS